MTVRSLLVRFGSHSSRDAFVRRVAERQPKLRDRLYVPKRRPDAVVDGVTEADEELLTELIGNEGQVFEDVKFETTDPSESS